jgi:hypothetical protein
MTPGAVMRKILVTMALHAKTHLKLCRQYQPIHVSNIAVAFAAVEACLNMHLMTEKYKIRQISDAYPFNGDTLVIMPAKLCNLRMMDNDLAVAKYTCLERRYAGVIAFYSPGMAHKAAKLLFGYMNAMAEGNRLLRRGTYRADRIKDEK